MSRFITFGNQKFVQCRARIVREAQSTGVFHVCKAYNDQILRQDTAFWRKHGDFLERNPRGYGYWLWKPYIICKELEDMKDDEVLVYADSGCAFQPQQKAKLLEHIQRVRDDPNGMFLYHMPVHTLHMWSKQYSLDRLNKDGKVDIELPICVAGILYLRKCNFTTDLMNQWKNTIETDPALVTDVLTGRENPNFKEHRHDQTVLSLLARRAGVNMLLDDTYPVGIGPISATRFRG
jgi:hypothetical protein